MDYSKMSDAEIAQKVWFWWNNNIPHDNTICCISEGKMLYQKNRVWTTFDPCNNPADAWPVIVENDIGIKKQSNGMWCATRQGGMYPQYQENPLRAAMMVFLHMQESANVQTDSTR